MIVHADIQRCRLYLLQEICLPLYSVCLSKVLWNLLSLLLVIFTCRIGSFLTVNKTIYNFIDLKLVKHLTQSVKLPFNPNYEHSTWQSHTNFFFLLLFTEDLILFCMYVTIFLFICQHVVIASP